MSGEFVGPRWTFQQALARQPAVDGNIAKLFNTGDSRPPTYFKQLVDDDQEASLSAIIYGREGIANCVDASPAGQSGHGVLGLDFRFERFTGEDALRYWRLLDLEALAKRSSSSEVDREKDLGLSADDCLEKNGASDLRILTVIEAGGGGMPGGLEDADSVLLRALMNIGEAQRRAGAAGSYGFGKAAVAQASRIRVLFVYTCTPKEESKDGVTRRFLGLTYWGMHRVGGSKYTGWGLFGDTIADEVNALEDEQADAMAARLDIPLRDPAVEQDRGTTFVIVDPSFTAQNLKGAVEVFWWPLLQKTRDFELVLKIWDEDGRQVEIEVANDHPLLGPFVDTFLEAEGRRKSEDGIVEAGRTVQIGKVGVTSLAVKDPGSTLQGSLIAQMRSPLMVVSYEKVKNAHPDVVGVFVAHEKTNENLRRVEPAEHDKWHTTKVAGLQATKDDIKVSKAVKDEVAGAVNVLRSPDPEPVYGISAFTRFFPAIDAKGAAPTRPKPKKQPKKQRLVRVHLVHKEDGDKWVEVERPTRMFLSDSSLKAKAFVKFFLDEDRAKKVGKESLEATVTVGAQFDEDGAPGEWHPAVVEQIFLESLTSEQEKERSFERTSGEVEFPARFKGRIRKGIPVFFSIETEPYDSDWTVQLFFDCSPWDVVEPTKARKEGD